MLGQRPAGGQLRTGSKASGPDIDVYKRQGLEELAASIAQYGVIQPLSVRRQADGYELVAGDVYKRQGQISADKAQSIALEHAEVRAKDATFVRSNLDWDDGRWVYEVEFYTADGMEYDYEIDAVSGAVVQYDHDAEYYKPQQSDNGTLITESKASQIALDRVSGASENNLRIKLDYDDGRPVYEGEIFYNSMEYEFEIDGYTGTVLEWSAESIYD